MTLPNLGTPPITTLPVRLQGEGPYGQPAALNRRAWRRFPIAIAGLIAISLGGAALHPTLAQDSAATSAHVPAAEARAEDVGTLDGILKAFYDVISGPAGQPRQWARDRTLYIPGARFVALGVADDDARPTVDVMDHQTFVDRSDGFMVREGFYEREIHRVTRDFGNLTHAFSTYEWRHTPEGSVQQRGVNSVQLFHDGARWWIAGVVWDVERPGNPIPPELLP